MSRVRSTPARAAALALAMLALLFAGPAAHVAHAEPNGGAAKGCALPDGTKAAPGDYRTVVTFPLRGGKLFGFVVVSICGEDGQWHPVDTTDFRTVGGVATVQWGATAWRVTGSPPRAGATLRVTGPRWHAERRSKAHTAKPAL